MLMLVMSTTCCSYSGWEAVGLVSYLLIGFCPMPSAIFANMKAFLVNRVGDFGSSRHYLIAAYAGTSITPRFQDRRAGGLRSRHRLDANYGHLHLPVHRRNG